MNKRNDEKMVEYLLRNATYAINSKSLNLVYQVYGEASMAYRLKALTWDEFSKLNTLLIRDTLNNGRLMNEWDKDHSKCKTCPHKRAIEAVLDIQFEED